jgi:hypothetical protein
MTFLLRRALAELEKRPAAQQDAVAAWLLDELADPRAWAAHFVVTTTTEDPRIALAQDIRRRLLVPSPPEAE